MQTKLGNSSVLVFVYGTLQRGECDYAFWMAHQQHSVFVARAETQKRYPLFVTLLPDNAACSPCLLNMPDGKDPRMAERVDITSQNGRAPLPHHVKGELFLVSERAKGWLDVFHGVEDGTCTVGEVDVLPLDNTANIANLLGLRDGEPARALVYFRVKGYPLDWCSTCPTRSSGLLRHFSSVECLREYGSRFVVLPAHFHASAALHKGLSRDRLQSPDDSIGAPLHPPPIVLFIIDGIGDVTYPRLGGRTPLEVVAGVPPRMDIDSDTSSTLDKYVSRGINTVTRNGVNGVMDIIEAGAACGSDTAHLSLFGYDPHQYYHGRGAYEALGAGLSLGEDDIAFKSVFSVMDKSTGIVTHRRCDRDFTRDGPVLCSFLNGAEIVVNHGAAPGGTLTHRLLVKYATEHRCGVVITGTGLSHKVTGTDPLADGRTLLHCSPTVPPDHVEYERALYTSRVVNAASERIRELLEHHPLNEARKMAGKHQANAILLRGAASKGWIPPFAALHGLTGFIVSPTCIIRGLGVCCGLRVVEADGATGDYRSNITAKVDAVLQELGLKVTTHTSLSRSTAPTTRTECGESSPVPPPNFAVIHVKGVDDAGHDGNLEEKLAMLQKCGDAIDLLWNALPDGGTMAVLADHSTPLSLGDHSCDPVPVSVATKGSHIADGVQHYGEVDCCRGVLGRFRSEEFMGVVKRSHYWYHYRHPCAAATKLGA
ncbi:putative 2,3-bisphosphoglycerate-independent phosphoglycerate mutase-like protein [Trypanosoma vivax]|nr:putative 2,3-bisphosphoglycerate-independent phosphoglycerate mutase-like protein [Trypanosoma vivax]